MKQENILKDRTFTKVYHIADLHIRNLKRHKEYRKVLTQFIKAVKKDKLNNALIYIAGDIAHAKTELSPELVREISWFLNECAKLHPTLLITGNHDCNMNNPSRLDALSPIVENLNNPNVHYLRDTGVYEVGNLTVGVYSIFSHRTEWPKGTDVNGEHKICFFHGPVDKSQTDIGYTVSSRNFPVDIFDGWDIAMLGDIHRRQDVQPYNKKAGKPIITYSGSAIQQNHGEFLEKHGYLLWDVPSRTYQEFDLKNEYGYVTIDIIDNEIPQWVYDEVGTKLPKHPRLRARFTRTDPSQIKECLVKLKKLFSNCEITVSRSDTIGQLKGNNRLNANIIGNVKELGFQNKLIRDYLERQFLLDDDTLDKIQEINEHVNASLVDMDSSGTVLWIPKTFEFSNMFSYGEDNKLDFTKANGIVGIFAPNASGKSSVWDALSFCIFDKSSRAFKAQNIMNNRKNQFYCKFSFEVNGIDYFIERLATRKNKDKNVKVDVNFWREKDGIPESLNGEQRRDTNGIIEQYLGTYDDFVLTALSLQGNNALFIDKSQSERKDTLSQFIGVDVFDKLYTVASEMNKETFTLIRKFKQDDFSAKLLSLRDELKKIKNEYGLVETELSALKANETAKNDELIVEVGKLITLNSDIKDIDDLLSKKAELQKKLDKIIDDTVALKINLDKYVKLQVDVDELLNSDEYTDIEANHKTYNEFINLQRDINHKIEKAELQLKSLNSTLDHLNEHEYNPECKICLKNSDNIIKNKAKVQTEIDNINDELLEYGVQWGRIHTDLANFGDVEGLWKTYSDLLTKKNKLATEISNIKQRGSIFVNNKLKTSSELEKVDGQIAEYYKHEADFKNNGRVNKEIVRIKKELVGIRTDIEKIEKELLRINGQHSTTKNTIEVLEDKIKEVADLEEQYKLYEYYLDAVKRDGISYELVSKVIPIIEGEVNNILGQMVEFGLQLEMDGKNINALIVYADQQWPLEMSSGMERFISGLAIRVALINICNLPRPNFLVVDEGFGVMDSENMASIFLMLNYLKTQFDFIMVVSHIDTMRDIVDQLIEIKKINGFSQLKF